MQSINAIYYNELGISFLWKDTSIIETEKIQFVFRDTGLLLNRQQIKVFSNNIQNAKQNSSMCSDCQNNSSCRYILIDSPLQQLTFAMNSKELEQIDDLVKGTLFQINLAKYLNEICSP